MYISLAMRSRAITELGEEKQCMCCGEYWPADVEFFAAQRSSKDGLSPRCIACIKERVWVIRRANMARRVGFG
jgi:hypothetical protein